jgi:hypothetical protein
MRLIDADRLRNIAISNRDVEMVYEIDHSPTVERPHGLWRDYSDEGFVECPFCQHATTCNDDIDELHFCFFCGASMVQKEGDRDEVD